MKKSKIVIDGLRFSLVHGISVELEHKLPQGWMMEEKDNHYVVNCVESETWELTVMDIATFISYGNVLLIRRVDDVFNRKTLEVVTSTSKGDAIRVYFVVC